MEKFRIAETMTFTDDTPDSVAIYTKDTQTEAEALMHKDLGGWMIKDNIESISIIVYNAKGFTNSEFWVNPNPKYPITE